MTTRCSDFHTAAVGEDDAGRALITAEGELISTVFNSTVSAGAILHRVFDQSYKSSSFSRVIRSIVSGTSLRQQQSLVLLSARLVGSTFE